MLLMFYVSNGNASFISVLLLTLLFFCYTLFSLSFLAKAGVFYFLFSRYSFYELVHRESLLFEEFAGVTAQNLDMLECMVLRSHLYDWIFEGKVVGNPLDDWKKKTWFKKTCFHIFHKCWQSTGTYEKNSWYEISKNMSNKKSDNFNINSYAKISLTFNIIVLIKLMI